MVVLGARADGEDGPAYESGGVAALAHLRREAAHAGRVLGSLPSLAGGFLRGGGGGLGLGVGEFRHPKPVGLRRGQNALARLTPPCGKEAPLLLGAPVVLRVHGHETDYVTILGLHPGPPCWVVE
ncbi:hypothetical protein GCM10010344_71090 [Streptomyces bluensis]|nr:hypothetical protein GCM10010344_71090 [Streptomyces bluensis]